MDIIENALIFFLVYIVMLFNHLSSLNYLLLYFFVLLYLKSNIKSLLIGANILVIITTH